MPHAHRQGPEPPRAALLPLRETYRKGGKVKNPTLANLSKLPTERIETLRRAVRRPLAPVGDNGFKIRRSVPHGHVLAALTTAPAHRPRRPAAAPCPAAT